MDQGLIRLQKAVLPVHDIVKLSSVFDDLLHRIHNHPIENSILLSLHAMHLIAETIEQTLDDPLRCCHCHKS